MYVNIETERLAIRPINSADAEFILELVNSKGWIEFIGDRKVSNLSNAEKYIQKITDSPNTFYNVFELKESQKSIGVVTFLHRDDEEFPDLGFALLPEYEKNGFTYEASKAYLQELMRSGDVDKIMAITLPHNIKSVSIIKKLGFEFEGNRTKGADTLSYFSFIAP